MSRLTASPFHKPKPFEFPRGLPSPPETNPDMFSTAVPLVSSTQSNHAQDFTANDYVQAAPVSADTPTSRLRKSSSIPYHSPGFQRDNKDRSSQRISKTLVVVLPPSTLLQDHGRNTTLTTNGPFHRLSQGIVMPLLPSMFAQVTAIAKEFNFPSTTGICLYYHYSEDGFTLTPRVSDDSWQSIWAHLSEPAGPNEKRKLISGKFEFDIDHRLARWYSAWISSLFREVAEVNPYPATAPSYGHGRAESRTTLPDGRAYDEDEGSVIIQQSAPVTITRHVPRKLSLVERFETASVRTEYRMAMAVGAGAGVGAAPRSIGGGTRTPPEILPSASQAPVLSPIRQEEEPKTARQDLDSRVKTWRASAILTPTPLAATGQTSLEPANLPNDMEVEMRMEDYTWSISSPGPSSYADRSPLMSEYSRIPSVHLDKRLQGSVCSTASYRTSFGPSDYDPFSPTFLQFEQRMPTPDIAQRFFEDTPPTPMTATSWGAPLEWPPSPRCVSPVPSLDLGERSRFDDVASQHSAMSHSMWRASLTQARQEEAAMSWRHVWPYTQELPADDKASAWGHVYPYAQYPVAQDASSVWAHVWPYARNASPLQADATWQHVWPYNRFSSSPDMTSYPYNLLNIYSPTAVNVDQTAYPFNLANIYPPVSTSRNATLTRLGYPYNLDNIYPPVSSRAARTASPSRLGYPHNLYNIYPEVSAAVDYTAYPHNLRRIYAPVAVARRGTDIQGYPHNLANIYPAVTRLVVGKSKSSQFAGPLESYPYNLSQIYPAGYPHNLADIYPAVPRRRQDAGLRLASAPTGYPYNLMLIYPPISGRQAGLALHGLTGYPHNLYNIYPPVSRRTAKPSFKLLVGGYPHNLKQIYAPVYPYNLSNIYPPVRDARSGYRFAPSFSSAGYPHNLAMIYPDVKRQQVRSAVQTTHSGYPHNLAMIYPPLSQPSPLGYPHNLAMIYPAISAKPAEKRVPGQAAGYPHNLKLIYPPVTRVAPLGYPHNLSNIYPPVAHSSRVSPATRLAAGSGLGYPYNLTQIYAPVYPYNLACIYPPTQRPRAPPSQELLDHYPHNLSNIYPPVDQLQDGYPHNLKNLYPPVLPGRKRAPVVDRPVYPFFDLYPSTTPLRFAHYSLHLCNPRGQYPHFEIYPSVGKVEPSIGTLSPVLHNGVVTYVKYPVFNLYPAVYPHFDLYPPPTTVSAIRRDAPKQAAPKRSRLRLTHAELHAMVMMEKMGSRGMQRLGMTSTNLLPDDTIRRSPVEKYDGSGLERSNSYTRTASSRALTYPQELRKSSVPPSLPDSRRQLPYSPSPSSSSPTPPPSLIRQTLNGSTSGPPVPTRGILRSSSFRTPPESRPPPPPIPAKPTVNRRDSLVFQRARAYDNIDSATVLTKETLAKFPMPPRIPLPPLPTDRRS